MQLPWNEVVALFEAAAARPDPERDAWLLGECAGRPDLYAEVASLLAAARAEAIARAEAPPSPDGNPGGRRYGAWETVRVIGTGGMGSVLLARRADGQFEQ